MDQDKASKPHPRRRGRSYDVNENYQGIPARFQPAHVMQYDRPFSFQPSRGSYHTPARNSTQQFPCQQIYLQHQPFGGHNRIPIHSFRHRQPMRYPSCPHQTNSYNCYSPGLLQNNSGPFEEQFRSNLRTEGVSDFNTRSFQRNNQGARPKTFKFNDRGGYHFRNKKNRNNSSNISKKVNVREKNNSKEALTSHKLKNSLDEKLSQNVDDNNIISKASSGDHQRNSQEKETFSNNVISKNAEPLNSESSGLEGAVGGIAIGSNTENASSQYLSTFDKNLIDEGAICDFDFQSQENFLSNGDNNRECFGGLYDSERNFLSSVEQDEGDSDMENCEYRHIDDKSDIGILPILTCYDSNCEKKTDACANLKVKCAELSGCNNTKNMTESKERLLLESDDVCDTEDTDDFIDTDLPLHNKHILSSSEDTSGSDNDEHLRMELFSDAPSMSNYHAKLSDVNCNDLSVNATKFTDNFQRLQINDNTNTPIELATSQIIFEGDKFTSNVEEKVDSFNAIGQVVDLYQSSHKILNNSGVKNIHSKSFFDKSKESRHSNMIEAAEIPDVSYQHNSTSKDGQSSLINVNRHETVYKTNLSAKHANEIVTSDSYNEKSMSCNTGYCVDCAKSTEVNNLNIERAQNSGVLVSCSSNVSSIGPCSNFSNDKSNCQQKVFDKFPIAEEQMLANDSSFEEVISQETLCETNEPFADAKRHVEDQFSVGFTDDTVDMVFLPMEEEIEPVHAILARGQDNEDSINNAPSLSSISGSNEHTSYQDNLSHLLPQDQNPLATGMPSKEFYELIKTVSTTDNCIRFFDKDGQDIQRQPAREEEDECESGSKADRLKVDKVMIWNEYEAYVMQYKQIAESACGPTAVLNVMKALQLPCEKTALDSAIITKKRNKDADIPDYLFSRSCAGTTAEDLMAGVEKLSQGTVGGRFFHFWPPRKVKLLQWLAYWMSKGGIPVATLNLQQGPHSLWQVPDSWHHQMIYGVSPQGLYLTNPLEIVSERTALCQVCSDSVLKIKRQDIISRFRDSTELQKLLSHPDPRWRTMNVLGQVVNVLREFNLPSVPGYRLQVTSHISIPACYKAGITLFMPKNSHGWASLQEAPELPLE